MTPGKRSGRRESLHRFLIGGVVLVASPMFYLFVVSLDLTAPPCVPGKGEPNGFLLCATLDPAAVAAGGSIVLGTVGVWIVLREFLRGGQNPIGGGEKR